jgi:hypothetical protein
MQPAQEKNKTPGQRIAPLTTDRSVSVLFLAGCNREPMDVGALDQEKQRCSSPGHSFSKPSHPIHFSYRRAHP